MKNPVRWLLHVPVPWVFVLAYLLGAYAGRWAPQRLSVGVPRAATLTTGCLLFAFGASIAGWALAIFYRARTTTVPGQLSRRFVDWGPYRFARNPMYVGLTLAYLGEAALMRQLVPVILLALVLAYVNWTVIPLEESRLREAYGDVYATYCSRVRRWL